VSAPHAAAPRGLRAAGVTGAVLLRLGASWRGVGTALAAEARALAPAAVAARVRAMPLRRRLAIVLWIGLAVAVMIVGNLPFGSDHGSLLPRKIPAGLVLQGVVHGAVYSLVAIGLVLIYRAGRYVNFAQGGAGAVGAVLTAKLVQITGLNFFLAAICGVIASALLAMLVELLVFQGLRIFSSPRLIATVATLGVMQLFGFFEYMVRGIESKQYFNLLPVPKVPIPIAFNIGIVNFGGAEVLVLVLVPLVVVGLGLFLRLTDFGAAIQAAAENADRARLVGITVRRMHTYVWAIAGVLSGLTAILAAPFLNFSTGASSGPSLFVLAFAPAVLGGMSSLPQTFFASLGLGVMESVIGWNYGSAALEVALLGVLLVGLVLRRRVAGRTTEGEERSFAVASRVRQFPRELSRLPLVRLSRGGFRLLLLGLAVVLPLGFDLQHQVEAENVVVFVIAGVSLVLLTGFSGQISFGQFGIVGFGALFGGWLLTNAGLDFWTGMLVVVIAGGLLAAVIGIPALRIRGLFLGAVTLAFALTCTEYFFSDSGHFPIFSASGPVQRPSLPFGWDLGSQLDKPGNELHIYWFCLGVLVLVMWMVRALRNSRWGRAFQAVRDNERAANAYGVGSMQTKLLAFVASGMIAALAGYLYVTVQQQVGPSSFPVTTSLVLFSAVVIGGLGSLSGAVIGGLFFEGVRYFIKVDAVQLLTTSLGLLVVLAFFPGGLGSLFFNTRDTLLRRYASHRRIVVPSLLADRRVELPTTLAETSLAGVGGGQ
jgi:branched-chain amino acid transport system permease protein